MTKRTDQAREELARSGFLARQADGYWSAEAFTPTPAFAERTILDLIRTGHARVTATARKSYRGKSRPTRIEKGPHDA